MLVDTATTGAVTHERTAIDVARPVLAIVGLGYVGLPTAISFADHGASVTGVEISPARVNAIHAGDVDLSVDERARLRCVLDDARLVTSLVPDGLREADVVIICVPTPVDEHLVPDTTALRAACATVVAHARPGQCLVLTSTSYVGTTNDLLVRPLGDRGFAVGHDIHVVFSPERIDPGNAVLPQHLVPRVVGGATMRCAAVAAETLALIASDVHIVSSIETAELTKLYENTFRAVNIAYANEMADVARHFGLDISEVIDAAATKPYGFMPFRPGPGVGGHCIPCDPHYLLWGLRSRRATAPVIEAAMTQIALRPGNVVDRAIGALAELGRSISGARVLVVGVAYKPGVADVRESPAVEIIERLTGLGAHVAFTDPLVDTITLHGGVVIPRIDRPDSGSWDLVVAHTVTPELDWTWAADVPIVLDASYRLAPAPNRRAP